MDPKDLAAVNRLLSVMNADQVLALADALESLEMRQAGRQDRGAVAVEQGSVVLTVKGGRVRFLEVRASRDIGRLDAEVPSVRAGRV